MPQYIEFNSPPLILEQTIIKLDIVIIGTKRMAYNQILQLQSLKLKITTFKYINQTKYRNVIKILSNYQPNSKYFFKIQFNSHYNCNFHMSLLTLFLYLTPYNLELDLKQERNAII